jgi:hypothetical protein
MNWLDRNKYCRSFLFTVGAATLIASVLLVYARTGFNRASERLRATATELKRLQDLNPFPNETNLRTLSKHVAEYRMALDKIKEELRTRALPVRPIQPNEFQAQLRETVTRVTEKARANRVKLPEIFFLGFEEFTSTLPRHETAPLLGQQLTQLESIANILIDARIDAITVFKRKPLFEEPPGPPSSSSARPANAAAIGPKVVERSAADVTFVSSPSALRRVINQIASANRQFYIIRALHVLNEKGKGPARVQTAAGDKAAETNAAGAKPNAALNFIVGNEHIQTSANIELVRFAF